MQYIWLIWSLILIAIWLVIYFVLDTKDKKSQMLIVSFWTGLTGLTEPLFVPEYWSPPSLFNLNVLTGFDIESVIWAFGVGGIAVVLYELLFRGKHMPVSTKEHRRRPHRFHRWAILSTPIILVILLLLGMNVIYASVIGMIVGGFATWYCRPDLKKKMITSAFLFLAFYFVYFLTLIAISPGYVEKVWNLKAISGILIAGIPLEELLFALSFGFIWSSIYEHLTWRKFRHMQL